MRSQRGCPFGPQCIILWISLIAVIRASSTLCADIQEKSLTLRLAVLYALENSPAFDSEKRRRDIRESEYKSAVAKFLPSFDFKTTTGLQNNIPIASQNGNTYSLSPNITSPWYSSVNLGLTENLYDNGLSITNLRLGDLNRDLSAIEFLRSRDQISRDIGVTFFRFSQETVILEIRREQQASLQKQFKILSAHFRQGLKTKSDVLRIKSQLQRGEIELGTAQNNIALSISELNRLLGVSPESQSLSKFEPVSIDSALEIEKFFPQTAPSLDDFYDYRIAKVSSQINYSNVKISRLNNGPSILLTSGLTYSNLNFINSSRPFSDGNDLSWNALLSFQYNLWDWGTRSRAIQIAEKNRVIQENTTKETLATTKLKVDQLMADVARIQRNFKLTQDLLALEEESSRYLEIQYREGKSTYLDLITSHNSVLDARIQFCNTYFEALKSHLYYKFYEGKLYDFIAKTSEK